MDNGASSYRRFRDNGDVHGLDEIIIEYSDGLILYLTSVVGNIQTAEELAEDTFVLLGTKKPKFREKSSFKTWLYAIGRNIAIDHLRKYTFLNSGAHLTALCRTQLGSVRIEDCITLDDFPQWLDQQQIEQS